MFALGWLQKGRKPGQHACFCPHPRIQGIQGKIPANKSYRASRRFSAAVSAREVVRLVKQVLPDIPVMSTSFLEGENEMKRLFRSQLLTEALLAMFVLSPFGMAYADSLTINYYTIAETDQDANKLCCAVISNEVLGTLGIHGLPVLNPAANGGFLLPKDILSTGEITYWSPALNNGGFRGASDVTFTGSATVTLPFNVPSHFYPPNGTGENDLHGFQAATLTGTLYAPTTETISFSIGSDDMAFVYLDGLLVCDDGGVHSSASVPCTTGTIGAGSHSLQLFFADLNNVESGLTFSVETKGVTTDPTTSETPEPGTLSLLGSGLLGLAGLVRRCRGWSA
jgi:hypothetical protein